MSEAKLKAAEAALVEAEEMKTRIWFVRWHIARWLIHTGLKVAPAGRTRSSLIEWIEEWARHVNTEILLARSALSRTHRKG